MTVAIVEPNAATRMGARIRALRRTRGLSLVQLADRAALSHPFLSQIERGRARPSMGSLERIARALGTSQVELVQAAELGDAPRRPSVLRADEGVRGSYGGCEARLLMPKGHTYLHPVEVSGANPESGPVHAHSEEEFVYVLAGLVAMQLDQMLVPDLGPGDAVHIPGGTSHRWWSPGGAVYRLIAVKTSPGAH